MSEPTANEADVVEQQQPAVPEEDASAVPAGGALPVEAEVADVIEQSQALPDADDDYPTPDGDEDDRA